MVKLFDCPEFRFTPLGGEDGKRPYLPDWQNSNNFGYNHPLIQNTIKLGGNIGLCTGFGNVIAVDFDDLETEEKILPLLPATQQHRSAGKGRAHLFYLTDNPISFKIIGAQGQTLADIQGKGKQIVVPPSKNRKTGRSYEVARELPLAFISHNELRIIFRDNCSQAKIEGINNNEQKNYTRNKYRYTCLEIARKAGLTTNSQLMAKCPFHADDTPSLSFAPQNKDAWHCFGCGKGGGVIELIHELRENGREVLL